MAPIGIWQQCSWIQRLFILTLFYNMTLILWGIRGVPAAVFTLVGISRIVVDLGLQATIGFLAIYGPLSFQRYSAIIAVSFLFGILFCRLLRWHAAGWTCLVIETTGLQKLIA